MAEQSQTKEEAPTWLTELPAEIQTWTKDHVRQWALNENLVDADVAEILHNEDIDGASLLLVSKSDLRDIGIKLGPTKRILCKRDELVLLKAKQLEENKVASQCNQFSRAYPFNRCHDAYRYTANSILEVTETGPSRYIEPCHEFKVFIHTEEASAEDKMKKFTDEALRFAAACMNSRTNGTIHFGVGDLPRFKHGEIVGVFVQDKEAFVNGLHKAIEGHFEHKHIEAAKKCIKPPRFVQVLNRDATSSDKYVIEVDIVAAYQICTENIYHIYNVNKQKARKKGQNMDKDKEEERKLFFIRDGTSSKDLLAQTSQKEYEKFVENIKQLSELRREAEKKHFTDVKASVQGSRLSEMLTGGSQSLDKSHFERYLLITNKSHDLQLESLEFLLEMDLTAVLDFDPESEINGLCKFVSEQRRINTHLPKNYKITEAVENIAEKLKLTKNTSWVFCNGKTKVEMPSDPDNWFTEKGASVRDVVSFLCRKDVLPQKKFLVVFLLLSSVSDRMDPLLESFSMFCQELQGTGQILCICEDERAFTCWNNLIKARYGLDTLERSIYELSLAEINGTILSLWSDNRRSSRFLPSGGGSKVLLKKKVEECLDTLSILCVNQCEGGTEERESLEESFYKGGEVSWWNFYFCEQPGSMPFIKRDKYDFIKDTIIPQLRSLRQACVSFNIMHFPGCGGTTLAKHILWSLKDTFRCAVLRDTADNFAEVARQVVDLLIHESAEHPTRLPVLLMMDDIEELDAVYDLQQCIDEEIVKRDCGSNCAQVILLNCMRTDSLDQTEATKDTVFIGNNLSESEQELFQKKLSQIEKTYKNADTFYGFMIMKTNFSQEYIQSITQNTLKNFNFESKPAQLFAVLTLLNVYWKRGVLSVSLCEDFLGMQIKPLFSSKKVEDEFGKFSAFLTRSTVEAKVVYQAIKVIHPSIANCCLQEITTTFKVSRAEILNMLLTNSAFFECTQGKDELMQDVRNILVKRQHMEKESRFSAVIYAIIKDTPGAEEMVLQNAAKCFDKDAIVAQLLARYQYLTKKDFRQAKEWARKAKEINGESSYIAHTSAEVIKHELKHAIEDRKVDKDPMRPEQLRDYLKMARSARDAFRETKEIAKKEIAFRAKVKRYNSPYNLAGCLGEIQVAVIIMDILEKVPVFAPSDPSRYNVMEQVLSGKMKIKDVSRNDNKHGHSQYYDVLEEFSDLICELKSTMKNLFNFLDTFFVILGPRYRQKDKQKERTVQELVKCFDRYVGLFCKSGAAEFPMKENLNIMTEIHKGWKFLEMHKADTHSGLLDCLSNTTSGETMEEIVRQYAFIFRSQKDRTVKDRVNFIYANIVLATIKPTSQNKRPYKTLLDLLYSVLRDPVPHKDSMALHFITVALLWPGPNPFARAESLLPNLGSYISQMRASFRNEMGSVWYGKKPVVHFYLGKKQGYDRLVYRADVERFAGPQSGSLGENEMWSHKEVQNLLCRATGVVQRNTISADTPHRDVKIEVNPVCKSQLCGGERKRVSFFIGFSMHGPLAFDVKFY